MTGVQTCALPICSAEGLREFKEGPAYIAIKAGVPVVPVAIVGMRELLPMGSIHLRSGKVVLRVGDPIPTIGMEASDRTELTARLYREVSQLLGGLPTAEKESELRSD